MTSKMQRGRGVTETTQVQAWEGRENSRKHRVDVYIH
jgi:hypothetical protein